MTDDGLSGYEEYYFDELQPELLEEVSYPDSIIFDLRDVPAYDPAVNVAVSIPVALVPLLAGLVRVLEWSALWNDPQAGYQVAALLEERLGQ